MIPTRTTRAASLRLIFALLAFAPALSTAAPDRASHLAPSSLDDLSKLETAIRNLLESREPIEPFGAILANIYDFEPELATLAKSEKGFSDRLQVLKVEPGSVAEKLGLAPGDQILQINDFYVSRGQSALDQFVKRVLPGVDWNAEVNATIIRDGYGQTHSTSQ